MGGCVNGPEEALLFLALPGQGKFVLLLCKSLKRPALSNLLALAFCLWMCHSYRWPCCAGNWPSCWSFSWLPDPSSQPGERGREATEPSFYGKSKRTRSSHISKTNLFPSIKLPSLNILCYQLIPAFCLRQPSLSIYRGNRDLGRHLNSHSAVSPDVSAHSYILQRKTWLFSSLPLPLPGNSFPVPFTLLHNKGGEKMFQCCNASRIEGGESR